MFPKYSFRCTHSQFFTKYIGTYIEKSTREQVYDFKQQVMAFIHDLQNHCLENKI